MATKAKNHVPSGYHSVTPYLVCKGAAKAIDWYKTVLGAEEMFRMPGPDGTIGHAELKLGDSVVMLADEHLDMGVKSPQTIGGSPVGLMVYVKDCDAVYQQAIKAGARAERPLEDKFYGDRSGTVLDPWGHKWTISTHVEDLTPEEMQRRSEAFTKQQK